MGDSDGVFGGNGSVEWKVKSRRTKQGSVKIKRQDNDVDVGVGDGKPQDRWDATGITDVDAGNQPPFGGSPSVFGPKPPEPFFTVTIELPKAGSTERQNFLAALGSASAAPSNVGKIIFYLPIVGNHKDQIRVEWPD